MAQAPTGIALAALIDHTLLRPDATRSDILQVCKEAKTFHFASVCVNSYWVPVVSAELAGSTVKVCAVIAFPFGAAATDSKIAEAQIAIRDGAQEIDMVQNVGALKSGDTAEFRADIDAVVNAARRSGAIVKVILETALLDDAQKVQACEIAKKSGAAFVKTSTGFGPGGATVHDVELMRKTVGPDMGVKASGGIRSYEDALKMIAAGANRIGASASVKIVQADSAAGAGTGY